MSWIRVAIVYSAALLTIAALVYSTALLTKASVDGSARGLVVVGSEEHYFGECRQGDVLTHTFTLINDAETPVQIVQLATNCGCLRVDNARDLGVKTIAPGERVALSISFIVPGVQDTASGRAIVAYRPAGDSSKAGAPSYVKLLAQAHVLPDYRISPSELDFGFIDGLRVQQVSRTLRITPAAENVQVQKVSSPNDFLRAQIVPPKADDSGDDPGIDVRVTVDVSRFAQSQSFNGSLIIATDSKRLSKALVAVRGKYAAAVEVEPSAIVLESDQVGEVSREVKVVSSHPSRIQAASCPVPERISVRFDGARVDHTHAFIVAVKPAPDRWLDSYVDLKVEVFVDTGQSISRTVRVLISRFSKKGFDHGQGTSLFAPYGDRLAGCRGLLLTIQLIRAQSRTSTPCCALPRPVVWEPVLGYQNPSVLPIRFTTSRIFPTVACPLRLARPN
ncbi:MAG: DUF1573 domain-containing protein, partial [Gemmataceae bacterium]|nr:DUF1573 domain-containing protein [Gemmataceae bacterium]